MTYISPEVRRDEEQGDNFTEIDQGFRADYELDHYGPLCQAEAPREDSRYLLGIHRQEDGVFHFGVHVGAGAEEVHLCIYDKHDSDRPIAHYPLYRHDTEVGAAYSGRVQAEVGQRYGYRVMGAWDPQGQELFNFNNLLVDPRARALDGKYVSHIDGQPTFAGTDLVDRYGNYIAMNPQDSAPFVPKAVVVDSTFDWGNDTHPQVDTPIIYEAHVKGMTALRAEISSDVRGTYEAVGRPENIAHLLELGVNVLELMPVQFAADEPFLQKRGKTNYWKYNTLGFFAPDADYAASGELGGQVDEFKQMVKNLHEAGIKVVLDVVYNHTPEGDNAGPSLSLKGLDMNYYLRSEGWHTGYSGCGNTTNASGAPMRELILDSLRYWVEEMHVDGFRVDLAAALLRDPYHDNYPNMESQLLEDIKNDPVFEGISFDMEPWDTGAGGHLLGRFDERFGEWNDTFRDGVRDFWRGHGRSGVLAYILSGSGMPPDHSVNAGTMHDGMTLRDWTEYYAKHNEANGEENRDGHNDNRSSNHGYEGPSTDPVITARRQQSALNVLTSMLVATGRPMILGGDEVGRTQKGNNNAYHQDNELSYTRYDDLPSELEERFVFLKGLVAFRKAHPVLQRKAPFFGTVVERTNLGIECDLDWFDRYGYRTENTDSGPKWDRIDHRKFLGMYWSGQPAPESGEIGDDSLLLYANGNFEDVEVTLPVEGPYAGEYEIIISTAKDPSGEGDQPFVKDVFEGRRISGDSFTMKAMSIAMLHRRSSKTNYPKAEPTEQFLSLLDFISRRDVSQYVQLV